MRVEICIIHSLECSTLFTIMARCISNIAVSDLNYLILRFLKKSLLSAVP